MRFEADLKFLPEMLAYIRSHLRENDASFIKKIDLACEEALVNIISHAYPPLKKTQKEEIEIECHHRKNHFEVLIIDDGIPFNPIELEINVDKDCPLDERKIGGLGIFLMRKLVDEMSYKRKGKKNVLTLILHFSNP